MKKLLLLILPVVLGLFGCSKSEEDEPQIIDQANVEWLKSNIAGNWYATHTFNSTSGIWVSTSTGYKNNSFVFSSNGEVTISDFNTLNGKHTYSLSTTNGKTMLKIGEKEFWVMAVDTKTGLITLYGLAKLEKR